jgi:hypothetical protein
VGAFNFKAVIVVIGALAAAMLTIDWAVYLSIDPGSLSAQMPTKVIFKSPSGDKSAASPPRQRN